MFCGLVQALNTTSSSKGDTTPRATFHTPFHFSANTPVQPHYPEANINGDAVATWDMTTPFGAKAGQIDGQSLHTVEENNSHDAENGEQYVVWDGSGLSLIRRLGQYLLSPTFRHSTTTPKRTTHQLVSSTGRAHPAPQ